jgi:hypothetical protein
VYEVVNCVFTVVSLRVENEVVNEVAATHSVVVVAETDVDLDVL